MSFDYSSTAQSVVISTPAERNRVLRNTYALLALSLVPTVLGAAVGVYSGLAQTLTASPWITLAIFMFGSMGLMLMVEKNRNSSTGVAWLMAFTFFMGLMLSRIVARTLGYSNGGQLMMLAFGGTAVVFAGAAMVAGMVKKDLSSMGKFLTIGAWVLFAAIIANMIFQIPALTLTILVGIVLVFSMFLMYDLNKIMSGGETNYISATLNVYLDVYNIFSALLALIGIGGGSRD